MSENTGNIFSFKADLKKFADETETRYEDLIRWVALTLWDKITDKNPVDTGRSRASWNLAVGSPDPSVPPQQESGASTIAAPPRPKIPKSALEQGSPIFVTSNLDYIVYLEGGSSDQAAGGMVEISIAEVEVEINNAISQL